ncbi:glycoside hydrolase [Ascobolus immersus RN42]|uniref:N,O-diacetylmuramidase n=1 Tax=Ascobolus immersus RN42 TaxID=1160509 RepID=A0A3N4HQD9_ASCIM|nr:glycoside hydrolase [Ascobolus immersus RN42]
MKWLGLIALVVGAAQAAVPGFDISHYQSTVNYQGAYNSGARFVIIKATEGTTYKDPKFSTHYTGATNAGLIRGGYHFARPASSTGAVQAQYFVSNGGGWSADGITLPGMLDLEGDCAGLSQSGMVSWVTSFVNKYKSLTGRYPMIYTTNSWWNTCTGNSQAFSANCPLVIARYNSVVGTIPGGWPYYTIWQFNDAYAYGGDSDTFNGSITQLKKLATG